MLLLIRRTMLLTMVLAAAAMVGCEQAPSGPQLDPAAFPRAMKNLHRIAADTIAAFESGEPSEADGALHRVGKVVVSLKRLAPVAGVSEQQQAEMNTAIESVLDTLSEFHAPMHMETTPEDFDHEPLVADLRSALAELRGSVPAEFSEGLEELVAEKPAEESTDAGDEESPAETDDSPAEEP